MVSYEQCHTPIFVLLKIFCGTRINPIWEIILLFYIPTMIDLLPKKLYGLFWNSQSWSSELFIMW